MWHHDVTNARTCQFFAVCLTVFLFEFRPRTFTIGFYGKKLYHIRAYDFGVQFSFNCLKIPSHFLYTVDPPMASWFSSCLYCRWFNKKCPKRCFSILPNTFAGTVCPRARPHTDVSAMIRHGASTTCLRLNLSPHYLEDQCSYFERSRGPGSRRGFAQGQS